MSGFSATRTRAHPSPRRKRKLAVSERRETVVAGRGVWKIFGDNVDHALDAMRSEDLDKEQVLDEFGAIVAVADVNFEVTRGEIFCVMGLSGSGKSTLIRHINRLIKPTAGELLVGGVVINGLSHKEMLRLRSEKIGMVFQKMALFPHWNIADNVSFGLEVLNVPKEQRRERSREMLELVQLGAWARHYPDELSGGMQQRVGLARALATDPELLLMDEPFSALDPLIRRQLQDEFLHLWKTLNKTSVFITHDLEEAIRLGDRIAIMKEGRFVQVGTPEAIVTEPKDDYVAEFVRGISKLKLVRAHSVMQPVEQYERESPGEAVARYRSVPDDTDLDSLIKLKTADLEPVLVVNGDNSPVGIVTVSDLLNGIRGNAPA